MQEIRGSLEGNGLAVAVVVSRYNETITRGLLQGTLDTLHECHVDTDDVTVVHVPGALELPLMCSFMAASGEYDAVIALGAVIKGETDHYEYVCSEVTRGCGLTGLDYGVPIAFGVLTCATLAQARDRSSTPAKNKGCEAARTAIETANVVRYWDALMPDDDPLAEGEDNGDQGGHSGYADDAGDADDSDAADDAGDANAEGEGRGDAR